MASKPRPTKIEKHGLAFAAIALRNEGLEVKEVLARLNAKLNGKDTIGKATLERFFTNLPAASAPVVHNPQVGEIVQAQVMSFGEQFEKLNRMTVEWLDEAETSRLTGVNDHGTVDLGPDWNARTKVAKELREQIKLMADTLERIYNAEQVKLFQESVLEAIGEASPEVAQAVRDRLRERTEIRKAALLGI
jgi:hypothetical protein